MSPRILRAIMQLFALFSSFNESKIIERKKFVAAFLEEEILKEQIEDYIRIFEQFVNQYIKRKAKSSPEKEIAVNSVKILSICNILNEELTQQQKIIILIKLLEILRLEGDMSKQAFEFISTVSETFKIPNEEFEVIKSFIFLPKEQFNDPSRILVITANLNDDRNIRKINVSGLIGEIYLLYIKIQNIIVFYTDNTHEVYLNQRLLLPYRTYVLSFGSAMRIHGTTPIYYSDIISNFTADKIKFKIAYEADKIYYKFKDNKIGIHSLSFTERNSRLVGIMGASGSGKTTLVNILNGSFKPSSGHVFINGLDLHENSEQLKGFIGFVSQDDLLIEELTVFENLYFNAKLCLDGDNKFTIRRKIVKLLKDLGLYEIKDMKVGSVMDRRISGGQRKRLNIALELLREPPILFLDEPTSGLSSRDSENIMDLLKSLTIDGKLIFVVIHQPSSTIFKMFDRLLVLDQGGYLIYNGKPIESILYFKSAIREADWNDTVCPTCGNVNPEQIFNIIETRLLNEYGIQTETRKFKADDWFERFNKYEQTSMKKRSFLVRKLPEITFKIPKKFKQFVVFTTRDILAKLSSLQYLFMNIFETPIMALVLSFIIKYWSLDNTDGYCLYNNENLPVYIFMSVIIAVFVGLSVSAEEIFKDRKILRRESFLKLSRFSYLSSKLFVLFLISAYQSFIFVLIGNHILGLDFFLLSYWIALFSVWFSANIMGLVISEAFDSSTTIYILIPFLVIPQLILTGVLVPFNKLNPKISNPISIPWYGEIFQTRWAYEAISVRQIKDNPYNVKFYEYDKVIADADYIKQYWCKTMSNKIDEVLRFKNIPEKYQICVKDLKLLHNEFTSKHFWLQTYNIDFNADNLNINNSSTQLLDSASQYLEKLKMYYNEISNRVQDDRDDFISRYSSSTDSNSLYLLKIKYHNEKLEDFVLGDRLIDQAIVYKDRIYRFYKPIYATPENKFFEAIFYSPTKPFFGIQVDTFLFNIIVIWIISLIEFLVLYYKIFILIINFLGVNQQKIKIKPKIIREGASAKIKKKSAFSKFIERFKN